MQAIQLQFQILVYSGGLKCPPFFVFIHGISGQSKNKYSGFMQPRMYTTLSTPQLSGSNLQIINTHDSSLRIYQVWKGRNVSSVASACTLLSTLQDDYACLKTFHWYGESLYMFSAHVMQCFKSQSLVVYFSDLEDKNPFQCFQLYVQITPITIRSKENPNHYQYLKKK